MSKLGKTGLVTNIIEGGLDIWYGLLLVSLLDCIRGTSLM